MARILVLGMAAVDFVLSMDVFPSEPTKYRAKAADIVGGGPAANAAVAIARLGGSPSFIGRLGSDPLADLVLNDLEAAGVGTAHVHRAEGGRSSFSSVYVDARGERQIVNFRGEGLTEEVDWIARLPAPDAVLVDTRWPNGAAAALDMAREWNVPGVVDGEAPIDPRLLEKATHVALSAQGLASLEPGDDLAAALERLTARIPGWACVTDGANGVWYTGARGIDHIPAFAVDVVDTLAAGDVWHGAFALSLAEGQAEADAIRFANATAALKCTTFGGRSGTPDRAAVLTFLKEYE
ncbi:PfkB family carbohydrate kinase [Aliiruegeria sabulilitoris]|uniref:PfkB family carbohydrate kinase n=1 Tax=Aliiruegeria sabulilitoris TaxID=1510458 RepID=UPI00082BE85A|nr:PfkB family carbohydrate kinase [Aliiruegeria sabulilitoris]NDR57013.1 sugar kinase [Pseudoruegeria sp. M32A2M]